MGDNAEPGRATHLCRDPENSELVREIDDEALARFRKFGRIAAHHVQEDLQQGRVGHHATGATGSFGPSRMTRLVKKGG
jgi:hypothetical protein